MKIDDIVVMGLVTMCVAVFLGSLVLNPSTTPDPDVGAGVEYSESPTVRPINPFQGVDGFTGAYKDPEADPVDVKTFQTQARYAGYVPVSGYGAVKVEGDKKTVIRRHAMDDHVVYEYEDVSHLDPTQAAIWATKGRPAPLPED